MKKYFKKGISILAMLAMLISQLAMFPKEVKAAAQPWGWMDVTPFACNNPQGVNLTGVTTNHTTGDLYALNSILNFTAIYKFSSGGNTSCNNGHALESITVGNDGKMYVFDGSSMWISADGSAWDNTYPYWGISSNANGIAVDREGNIYLVDIVNNRILKYTCPSPGDYFAGTWTVYNASAKLIKPMGIAIDSQDHVYVTDAGDKTIKTYSGSDWTNIPLGGATLSNPNGIAIDGNGDFYVADGTKIVKIYNNGSTYQDLSGSTSFTQAASIAVDLNGHVYVVDTSTHKLMKYGPMCTVTFDSQGGSLITQAGIYGPSYDGMNFNLQPGTTTSSIKVSSSGLFTPIMLGNLANPTKDGYNFGGWYKNAACTDGNEWHFYQDWTQDKVTSDVTLYAKWILKQYTITFDPQDEYGGNTTTTSTATSGSYLEEPQIDTSSQKFSYYDFVGWYTDPGCAPETKWDFAKDIVTGDMTLYGGWAHTWKVLFYESYFANPTEKSVVSGKTVDEPMPTKDGYVLDGWYTDPNFDPGTKWDFNNAITQDTWLYAKWIRVYTVYFDSQGGTSVHDITSIKEEEKIAKPTDPTKDGFTFDGWYEDPEYDPDSKWDFDEYEVYDDMTLYAKWTANAPTTYTLTYIAGANGNITGTLTQTVTIGGSGTTVTAVANAGYHFIGWSDGVTTASRTDSDVSGNISVTANFEQVSPAPTLDYAISLSQVGTYTFTGQTVGYTPVTPQAIMITNIGTGIITNLQATLSGINAGNFTLGALGNTSLSYEAQGVSSTTLGSGEYMVEAPSQTTFTVKPNDGLAPGSYTATVTVTGDNGVSESFNVSFTVNTVPVVNYTFVYNASSNGYIVGNAVQAVAQGGSGSTVTAVASSGYHFSHWSDGVTNPSRTDSNASGNITVTAYFTANSSTPNTPSTPPASPIDATGTVIDESTGQTTPVNVQVTTDPNGSKTIKVDSEDIVLVKQPDGTNAPIADITRLGLSTDNSNVNITIGNDGSIHVGNLPNGSNTAVNVTYDLGNGVKIVVGTININVGPNGSVNLKCSLIDPYGIVTDAATGKVIAGADVKLYYADTERNKKAGKTPDTLVNLPTVEKFPPADNANPQQSDKYGNYAFMVFPDIDYYVVAKKDGYNNYISDTISVNKQLVRYNIKMTEKKGLAIATFVGIEHSPLIEGDTETFYLNSINADKVQYRMFLYNEGTGIKEELTNGYSKIVPGNVPYVVNCSKKFAIGHYKLITWVREVGSNSEYDTTYTANLNCVNRDDTQRVYANDNLIIDKETYKLGEIVKISGIQNLSGIKGPYKYRLHLYNATKNVWIKNVTAYGDDIEWVPTEAGVYVLDVYADTPNSTTWAKYLRDPNSLDVYGTYEVWKLKIITVEP